MPKPIFIAQSTKLKLRCITIEEQPTANYTLLTIAIALPFLNVIYSLRQNRLCSPLVKKKHDRISTIFIRYQYLTDTV